MNVEQLIEDAEKSWMSMSQVFRDTSSKLDCVEFGVRHAIAAMFQVVNRMDQLAEGEWYYIQNVYDGSWEIGKWERTWTNDLTFLLPESSCLPFERCTEIRRCPTPSELGVG